MRPRISFKRFREIFSISQWMLLSNIGTYLRYSLHRMLIGRWSSATTMGAYTLADEISSLPSAELLAPINRALFPAFAKVKDDISALKEKVLMAQAVQTLIALPAAMGLLLVAEEAVPVLLGENWRIAVPFVQILALVNIVQALTSSGYYALLVLGNIRESVLFIWAHVLVFAALALSVFFGQDATAIAWLRLVVTIGGLCLLFWLVFRALPSLRVIDLVAVSWRPVIGAGLMALGLKGLSAQMELSPALALGFQIVAGVVIYTAAVGLLWWLAGRRPGAESYILGKVVEHAPPRWRSA
jgi:O-antigen/teichoic acid export membrane protein